jgi:hypothetical protein
MPKRITIEEFIKKSIKIHGNKYNYDNVNYVNNKKKISIICNKHGEFKQTPEIHLKGSGCPKCMESKGEKIIREWLEQNNIDFVYQKTFSDCRGKRNPLPFDFYFPNNNLLIEYDGIQHYKPVRLFNGENGFKETKNNDKIKNEFAQNNNIQLLRISYMDSVLKKLNNVI